MGWKLSHSFHIDIHLYLEDIYIQQFRCVMYKNHRYSIQMSRMDWKITNFDSEDQYSLEDIDNKFHLEQQHSFHY